MKHLYTLLYTVMLLSVTTLAPAQTTSMDFHRTACDGTDHQLFTELDGGKVVILDYVMLGCTSCIIGTNGLEQIYKNFESSNPGRVKFYAFGYDDNYTCQQLTTWMTSNHFSCTMFEDGAQQTGYYGGMGMPTIVVTGTNTHTVLYHKLGYEPSDDAAIIAAINTGLQYNPQGVGDAGSKQGVTIYPSVFSDRFTVLLPHTLTGWIGVYDLTGQEVLHMVLDRTDKAEVDGSQLRPGLYFATIFSESTSLGSYKLIRK